MNSYTMQQYVLSAQNHKYCDVILGIIPDHLAVTGIAVRLAQSFESLSIM
jgi:hypothetical protein